MLQNRTKRFRTVKNQLGYASKIFDKELVLVKSQSNQLQKKLLLATEDNKVQILALQEKLQTSDTQMEMLRNQLDDIYRSFEEPIETCNLQDCMEEYFGKGKKVQRRRKMGTKTSSEESAESDRTTKEGLSDSPPQTERGKVKATTRILQLRNENLILVDAGKQLICCLKDERNMKNSLLEKVKEVLAITSRTSGRSVDAERNAPSQLKLESEDMMEILTAIKEQKIELQRLNKIVEVLDGEKVSVQSSLLEKEKRLHELETVVHTSSSNIDSLQNILKALHQLLTTSDTNVSSETSRSVNSKQRQILKKNTNVKVALSQGSSKIGKQEVNSPVDAIFGSQLKGFEDIFERLQALIIERDKLKIFSQHSESDRSGLERQLVDSQNLLNAIVDICNDQTHEPVSDAQKLMQLGKVESHIQNNQEGLKDLLGNVKCLRKERDKLKSVLNTSVAFQDHIKHNVQELLGILGSTSSSFGGDNTVSRTTCSWQDTLVLIQDADKVSLELESIVRRVQKLKEARDMDLERLKSVESEKDDLERRIAEERGQHIEKSDRSQKQLDYLTSYLKKTINELNINWGSEGNLADKSSLQEIRRLNQEDGETAEFAIIDDMEKMKNELLQLRESNEKGKGDSDTIFLQLNSVNSLLEELCNLFEMPVGSALKSSTNVVEQGSLPTETKNFAIAVQGAGVEFETQLTVPGIKTNSSVFDIVRKATYMKSKVVEYLQQIEEMTMALVMENKKLSKELQTKEETAEKLKMETNTLSKELKIFGSEFKEQDNLLKTSETKWKQKVEVLKKELLRLGGYNLENPQEISRRAIATERVYQQLEVGGSLGGITQAAIHYFQIDPQSGEVTFQDVSMPGSQSSSMLVELVLLPINNGTAYESKSGDVLGLCIKVQAIRDRNAREILYNNNVLHTDEVMEAVKGQPISNFSLWPDLVSSWKWERSTQKGWNLVSIRWRFLLKNIFPELSEPLQSLAICGTSHGMTNSFMKNS
ncbi:hypothetical protein O6H91_23G045600 [Diphasiastrum complanatum]|uniref:Uncharacterized protein n=1 Tax=Diphasiastrum complanatum TaxID=34168 RepID=A0ACC2AAB3_DIPCM|nr:hypothetical protein O6H91_23G045600 [Diphasiastrum complanatum]